MAKVHSITAWMKHTKENRVRIDLELFIQRLKMQKGKGDAPTESEGSE